MKNIKIIITVILTILIIVSSFVAIVLTSARSTILSPSFYSKKLVKAGAYDVIYDKFVDILMGFADSQPGITDEYRPKVPALIEKAMPKDTFTKMFGEFIGDGFDWLVYNGEDKDVPLRFMVETITTSIENDEDAKAALKDEFMVMVMSRTFTDYFVRYYTPDDYGDSYSDYVHFYLGGNSQRYMDNMDYITDVVVNYYGKLFNIFMWLSILVCVLSSIGLYILHYFVYDKNIKYPLKLCITLMLIYGIIFIFVGLGMYAAGLFASNTTRIPASIAEYIPAISSILYSLASLSVLVGVLNIGLSFIGRYIKYIFIKNDKETINNIIKSID